MRRDEIREERWVQVRRDGIREKFWDQVRNDGIRLGGTESNNEK